MAEDEAVMHVTAGLSRTRANRVCVLMETGLGALS